MAVAAGVLWPSSVLAAGIGSRPANPDSNNPRTQSIFIYQLNRGANNGWTLTLNATTPGTGKWTSGSNTYQYNGNATTGQLTVNPAAGTLTSMIGASTGITLGSQAAFSGTSPVTLISAAAGSDDVWRGYVTGVGLSQAIPAGQAAGTYTLPMTQTVAAI